MALWTLVVG